MTANTEYKGEDSNSSPKDMAEVSSVAVGKADHFGIPSHEATNDEAAKYADMFNNGETYSRSEWVKLRWKLDLRLVPLLWFNITLGAMDKITTSTAALYGFRADTGLSGDRYSWVGSVFYVSLHPPIFLLLELLVINGQPS